MGRPSQARGRGEARTSGRSKAGVWTGHTVAMGKVALGEVGTLAGRVMQDLLALFDF